MFQYLAISAAVVFLCIAVGTGFYLGVRHVEEMSHIIRNPERPRWAQEPVDAFNRIVGKPPSAESLRAHDDDADEREEP